MICNISKILIGGITVLIFITGCSSSTYNERFSKTGENQKEKQPRSVRFTSKEKSKENETQTVAKAEIPQIETGDTTSYNDIQQEEFDETPVDDSEINTDEFVKKYSKLKQFNLPLTQREKILFEIVSFIDTPYKYGGSTSNGIDCSSFTQNVFKNSLEIFIPRTAREQYKFGDQIDIPGQLKFGDLVFFNTSKRAYPGHVGIYLGDNLFAHASRKLGVTVSSIKTTYYAKRYIGARRVLNNISED